MSTETSSFLAHWIIGLVGVLIFALVAITLWKVRQKRK